MAVITFLSHRYVVSGAMLGLGVLMKIYPVYLIAFMLIVLLFPLFQKGGVQKARQHLEPLFLFIMGGAFSIVTLLPFLLKSGTFLDYILRRGSYTSYGGLSMWFFFTPLESMGLIMPGGTLILVLTFLVVIGASLWYVFRTKRNPGDQEINFLMAATAVLTIVLLINSVTNAQYLLWLLPFLLLIYPWEGRMLPKFALLTIAGLLFSFTLQSIFAFQYPLASFTGIVSITETNSLVLDYFTGGGMLSRTWALGIIGGFGAFVMLTVLLPKKYDPLDKALAKLGGLLR